MDLSKLTVTPVARDDESRFRALMDEHHCLGAPSKIGQTVWYAADDGSGEWSALAALQAAALKCGARDAWIGWGRREWLGRLHPVANNVRLPLRGQRPNLGSRFPALCTAATLCGATGWKAIHEWIQDLGPTMQDHFRCRRINGVHERPGIHSIRNMMIRVEPDQLAPATARFCRDHGWDQGAGIAVDGKTVRPAGSKKTVLTADDDGGRATNETGTFIPTMDLIPDIAGRTVTADAPLTRTAVSACLHDRGAHFMFVAKGNRKNLPREIRGHFSPQAPREADFANRSPQPEHGRTRQRGVRASTDPMYRISFPWVGQVFMIKRTVQEYRCARNGKPAKPGKPSVGIVYGITGHTPETADAEVLPGFNRAH